MSRIGKLPISIPQGVEVSVKNEMLTVKGKLGALQQRLDNAVKAEIAGGKIVFERENDLKTNKSKHGLYRALIANMIEGVTNGYSKNQELVGVGYKATNQGQMLELTLGYSHNVVFELPKEITVKTVTERGKNPIISIQSIDKQLIGQVAAKIRELRAPEPYKGKGIKFVGEQLRRKAGKAAGK